MRVRAGYQKAAIIQAGYREAMHMQDIINYAIKKWELDHLEVIYEHSTRGVFSAESKDFGPVILKVNQHKSQLESEYRMLAQLAGVIAVRYMRLTRAPGFSWRSVSFRGRCCAGRRLWKKEFRCSYRYSVRYICPRTLARPI